MRDGPRELVRRFVCWLLGHSPVGPPYYSPGCARCGLPLRSDATPWGQADDDLFINEIQFASGPSHGAAEGGAGVTGDPLDRIAQIDELRRKGQLGAITVSDILALVNVARAARDLRESLRIETYHGVKYKIICPRCGGLGEVGPENHDDPKAWPCSDCEGLGVRPPVLAAIRSTDAALARLDGAQE